MKILNSSLRQLFSIIKENFGSFILSIFGLILFIFSSKLLYSYYSTVDCILDFTNFNISNKQQLDPNEYGDYFGGVMNPLIGITAAFITFLAFYIQFVANRKITNQFKIQQFESQFYEMIRLHKENVNELEITQIEMERLLSSTGTPLSFMPKSKSIKGREVFKILSNELEMTYRNVLKYVEHKKIAFEEAYGIFFNGLDIAEDNLLELTGFRQRFRDAFLEPTRIKQQNIFEGIFVIAKYELFQGHENQLGHYYRHLYQSVKFVANYDSAVLKYRDKRKYLRLLRAQLSNYEQLMLFYNWYSGYGYNWEKNKFFSEFRMIHNLPNNIFFDFDKEHFKAVKQSIRTSNPKYTMLDDQDYLYESDRRK